MPPISHPNEIIIRHGIAGHILRLQRGNWYHQNRMQKLLLAEGGTLARANHELLWAQRMGFGSTQL